MAWGDLRYDHSDIFGPPVGVPKPPSAPSGSVRRCRKVPMGPGHPTWEGILQRCRRPATARQIAQALNHRNPRGNLAEVLRRMTSEGLLARQQESLGSRGTRPFVYRTVERMRDGEV